MRCWSELRTAIAESPYGILDLEPEESTALLYATLLLGTHSPLVPRSWSRSRLNPAACLLATSLFRPGGGEWGPAPARLVTAPFKLPASCEVATEIFRVAFADGLLRPTNEDAWTGRTPVQTRDEAVVRAGPRLIAALEEERERWTAAW